MRTLVLALLLASPDGGVPHAIPPMLRRPEAYRFVPWEPGGVPEQLRAPCPNVRQIWTVNGLCWGKTVDKVPCPPETHQAEGACWLPVVRGDAPTSPPVG